MASSSTQYESLAYELNDILENTYKHVRRTHTAPASIWMDNIIKFEQSLSPHVALDSIINTQIYDWYEGTVINKLIVIMFQPYLLEGSYENYEYTLPPAHLHAVYKCIVYLIHCHNLNLNTKDYYNTTPRQYIMELTVYFGHTMPPKLKPYLFSCAWIVRNASRQYHLIKLGVSKAIERYLTRKKAAQIIKYRWLEYAYSPETRVGKKMIAGLSKDFYSLAATVDNSLERE